MLSISKRPFEKFLSSRIAAAAICAVLGTSSYASAQETAVPVVPIVPVVETPPTTTLAAPSALQYGQAGQWFLSGETYQTFFATNGGGTGDVSWTWASGANTLFNINLQPVAGYFITDLIYVRLGFNIAYKHVTGANAVSVGVAPGVGVAVPVFAKVVFAPWVGLNFLYTYLDQSNSASSNREALNLEVHAPLVIGIADHFALATGVYYAQGLVDHFSGGGVSGDNAKTGNVGLTAGLLGYW